MTFRIEGSSLPHEQPLALEIMSTTTMQGASAMDGNGTLHKNMIVQENSFAKIKARLEEVTDKGQKLAPDDLNARRQLLDAARTLCTELESPMEAVFRTVIIQVAYSDPASRLEQRSD
jgi:hypothetical protein